MIPRICIAVCLFLTTLGAVLQKGKQDSKIPMVCENEFTYGVFGCNNTYYKCADQFPVLHKCPPKYYFDITDLDCKLHFEVHACSNPGSSPRFEHNKNDLPACGSEEFVSSSDPCSRFYGRCSNGTVERRMFCPYGQVWEQASQSCVLRERVEACKDSKKGKKKEKKDKPISKEAVPSTASIDKMEFTCANRKDGIYVADEKACTNIYYNCVKGETFVHTCRGELWFDVKINECSLKTSVPACGGATLVPVGPPIGLGITFDLEKQEMTTSFQSIMKCKNDDNHGVYGCSIMYYKCVKGIPRMFMCPPNKHFNIASLECTDYFNIEACTNDPNEPRIFEQNRRNLPECKDQRYVAHETCSRFYAECVDGTAKHRACPLGQVWVPEEEMCRDPTQVQACREKREDDESKETIPDILSLDDNMDLLKNHRFNSLAEPEMKKKEISTPYDMTKDLPDCENQVFISIEEPCSPYYGHCINGVAELKKCPEGRVWLQKMEACQFENLVPGCEKRGMLSKMVRIEESKSKKFPLMPKDSMDPKDMHLDVHVNVTINLV